jgi:hypothetical protein
VEWVAERAARFTPPSQKSGSQAIVDIEVVKILRASSLDVTTNEPAVVAGFYALATIYTYGSSILQPPIG